MLKYEIRIKRMKKAFTLIELLIVIAIIGVLAGVILVSTSGARQKATVARKKTEISSLFKAVQAYYIGENSMPVNVNGVYWCQIGVSYSGNICLSELVTKGYVTSLPMSPDNEPYYYRDNIGGKFGMISSKMKPEEYGPGNREWCCKSGNIGSCVDAVHGKFYCLEFNK